MKVSLGSELVCDSAGSVLYGMLKTTSGHQHCNAIYRFCHTLAVSCAPHSWQTLMSRLTGIFCIDTSLSLVEPGSWAFAEESFES
jgi:hypothetical protein